MNDTGAGAGLQIHTRLKPSVVADRLARTVQLAACCALVASLLVVLDAGWTVGVPVCGLLAGMAWFIVKRPAGTADYVALSVDAGGNWSVADAAGWHRFTPDSMSRSAFGWITLEGLSRPATAAGAMRADPASRRRLVIWFDCVPLPVWRRINVAATWLRQRQQGLEMPASAADPRLGGAP